MNEPSLGAVLGTQPVGPGGAGVLVGVQLSMDVH